MAPLLQEVAVCRNERADAAGNLRAPRVSVCIANWNCRDHLRACLTSLRRSQGVSLEVIVIDNASTDGAAELVATEFPEVRLVGNPSNRGFAAANNQAARLAGGEFLFFLNNDTVVPPTALNELVEFLEAHPDVALVGPRLVGTDGRPQCAYRRLPTPATYLHRTWFFRLTGLGRTRYRAYRRPPCDEEWPSEVETLLGAAVMMARRRFDELGGWDEQFTFGGEDLDLCWRARRFGSIIYNPRVTVIHVGSAGTKQNIAYASPRILVGFARFFRKAGASRAQLFCYKLAVTLDAPAQILANCWQYLWRRLCGRRAAAAKSWNDVKGAATFLWRGLMAFWKA